jgi:N-acetylneuraminic acid mutarotase
MTDLHTRFRTLDDVSTPDLWHEIEERAMAAQPMSRRLPWVLIVATLLLALAFGGAALVGSGIIKIPVSVESSASPSTTPHESAPSSTSPIEQSAPTWTATGNMLEARTGDTATLLRDGKVLVVGGGGSGQFGLLATAELYDPVSGSWAATGSMNGVRVLQTATLLEDGKVLVAGGADSIGETSLNALATAELYDPDSGSWTATGNMIEARARHTATLLPDGRVLVVGGSGSGSGSDALATAELYDPDSGSWTATGNMIEARARHTATLLPDGTVLIAGGDSAGGPQLASAELYDPSSGSWTATAKMHGEHAGHRAIRLPDGTVLVLGGSSGGPGITAELYNPSSRSWTTVASMNGEHIGGSATLLRDGTVLVAGGGSSNGSGGEELYDPSSDSWTVTANLLEARTDHTAALLPDGTVLVAGGGAPTGLLATAELYDPGSGT